MEVKTMNLVRFAVAFSLAVLQCACAATTTSAPLVTTPGSTTPATQHNSEGIARYDIGDWSGARDHFASAIKADPNLAESHFNLALALDKLNLHSEATTHFKKAAELAPGNSAITQSSAYRDHTASPSSSYGTGGYGTGGFGGMGGY
jgi:Tfp pilus assembly protein PilF